MAGLPRYCEGNISHDRLVVNESTAERKHSLPASTPLAQGWTKMSTRRQGLARDQPLHYEGRTLVTTVRAAVSLEALSIDPRKLPPERNPAPTALAD